MGILEKKFILGSADASPNMIFFKDPIYFRITPLSVYITNNTHAIINHIVHVSELKDLRIQILKVSKCQHECRSERHLSPHQALINLDRIRVDSS